MPGSESGSTRFHRGLAPLLPSPSSAVTTQVASQSGTQAPRRFALLLPLTVGSRETRRVEANLLTLLGGCQVGTPRWPRVLPLPTLATPAAASARRTHLSRASAVQPVRRPKSAPGLGHGQRRGAPAASGASFFRTTRAGGRDTGAGARGDPVVAAVRGCPRAGDFAGGEARESVSGRGGSRAPTAARSAPVLPRGRVDSESGSPRSSRGGRAGLWKSHGQGRRGPNPEPTSSSTPRPRRVLPRASARPISVRAGAHLRHRLLPAPLRKRGEPSTRTAVGPGRRRPGSRSEDPREEPAPQRSVSPLNTPSLFGFASPERMRIHPENAELFSSAFSRASGLQTWALKLSRSPCPLPPRSCTWEVLCQN
ncbi:translation initiation factor IF-2-like [Bubalus kerabau]|uniref:translation initiation factor IF-2-like n=1 Tax=Bubalus carabanensis TaxID=3119969 RepID=UPI00244EA45C|nr:translation initiation factor IF-2-like [Bubalus carabanensis]